MKMKEKPKTDESCVFELLVLVTHRNKCMYVCASSMCTYISIHLVQEDELSWAELEHWSAEEEWVLWCYFVMDSHDFRTKLMCYVSEMVWVSFGVKELNCRIRSYNVIVLALLTHLPLSALTEPIKIYGNEHIYFIFFLSLYFDELMDLQFHSEA